MRLFALVYLRWALVTVFLSNDATAVVLTPAVYAATQRAGCGRCRICDLRLHRECSQFRPADLQSGEPRRLRAHLPTLWIWLASSPSRRCGHCITFIVLRLTQRTQLTEKSPGKIALPRWPWAAALPPAESGNRADSADRLAPRPAVGAAHLLRRRGHRLGLLALISREPPLAVSRTSPGACFPCSRVCSCSSRAWRARVSSLRSWPCLDVIGHASADDARGRRQQRRHCQQRD